MKQLMMQKKKAGQNPQKLDFGDPQ